MNMRADRYAGDRADDQHRDAGRHRFAHHGGGGQHRGAFGRAVAFAEFVAHHRADGGDVGRLRAGQSRDDIHAGDGDLQQAALHMADQRVDEAHQPDADAAAFHHQAGENEERHREQNEIAGAVDHGLRQHHQRCGSGAPQIGRGRQQQHEADGNAGENGDEEQAERGDDRGVVAEQRQPDVAGQRGDRDGRGEGRADATAPSCRDRA